MDLRLGKLLISFDTRIARQLNGESDDYNIYSFMIMVGK